MLGDPALVAHQAQDLVLSVLFRCCYPLYFIPSDLKAPEAGHKRGYCPEYTVQAPRDVLRCLLIYMNLVKIGINVKRKVYLKTP